MPKVCNLYIRLVWLSHHKMVMMLQKQHIRFWLGDQIAILCTFFVAKMIYALYLSRKRIYALRPECFCALIFAIRKVQTFWGTNRSALSQCFDQSSANSWLRWGIMTFMFQYSAKEKTTFDNVIYNPQKTFIYPPLWLLSWSTWSISTNLLPCVNSRW